MRTFYIIIAIFFYCITLKINGQPKDFFCNSYDTDINDLELGTSATETRKYSLRYNLKIQLKEIRIIRTCEIDGKEDLHGNQMIYKVLSRLNNENRNLLPQSYSFWYKQRGNNTSRRSGQKIVIDKKIVEIKNLSIDEIKNLEIWFGGDIYDYEPLYSMEYNCLECSEPQQNPNMRVFNINSSNTRINEIERIIPNNQYKQLTVGSDKILELNYEEGFGNCISKIKAIYELSAKAY